MRHDRSITLRLTSLLLLGLAGCATDSMQSSTEPLPTSQIAQTPGENAQPPSGGAQEPGTVQPSPGTDVPPATAGAQGQEAQGEQPSGDVQERGLPFKRPPGEIATVPLSYVGPTQNLTNVANAIRLKQKSLTTLVTAAPGLQVTQPIEISIGYYSPAGSQRITQFYVPSSGNHFLYNDKEGDGKPRRMHMEVSLREPKPGGFYTFAFSMEADLEPLYDVTISPLSFTLFTNCDLIGKSEITFSWLSPDNTKLNSKFSTSSGKHVTVNQFAWSRVEVSASANRRRPVLWFTEKDVDPGLFPFPHGSLETAPVNLVPGITRQVVTSLKEENGDCTASAQYNITYNLRWYPYL